jgi:hypothetical protein
VTRALPIVAALCLAGGFADLALGGASVSAVLLVAGYAIAVPSAILHGRLPARQRRSRLRLSR